jgi:AraC-like DNA-binding protein
LEADLSVRTVERVIDAMHERLDCTLTLDEMAEIALLSPFHFARLFRDIVGVPPGAFHAALRLAEAKRLLLTTQISVTDVCFAVGYRSLGSFTTRFTNLVGLPPGRLRDRGHELDIPRRAPQRVAEAAPRPDSVKEPATPAFGALVRGYISGDDVTPGPLFVGLFPTSIAQGRPVLGTLLPAPGPYALAGVPDGCYYLVAAALPWSGTPLAYLLPDDDARLRIGRSAEPVSVRQGRASGVTDLALRRSRRLDPPVVVALPSLLCPHCRSAG